MKKSFAIAVLGLAAAAVSSFGQGSIQFNSYLANNSAGIPIYFPAYLGGGLVGAGFTADLLWSLSPISGNAGTDGLNPGWTFSGSGGPSLHNVATPFGTGSPIPVGYFASTNNFVLNPYTPGTLVYFEVIFYQTAAGSYANSIIRGHSAAFSSTLATEIILPGFLNFPSFFVVPEPTTLALAGLGGVASLVVFRRKQV